MGFYVLDLYPYYQAKMKEFKCRYLNQTWISKDPVDAHPNPAGHRLIADALLDYIKPKPDLLRFLKKMRKNMP